MGHSRSVNERAIGEMLEQTSTWLWIVGGGTAAVVAGICWPHIFSTIEISEDGIALSLPWEGVAITGVATLFTVVSIIKLALRYQYQKGREQELHNQYNS